MSDVVAQLQEGVCLDKEESSVEPPNSLPDVPDRKSYFTVRGYRIPELWGPTMVAEYLGVRQSNLMAQVGLPQPVPRPPAPTIGGRLWIADEIRDFKRQRDEW